MIKLNANDGGTDKIMQVTSDTLKVAIVHDWLVSWSGAEKVLEQMLLIWPHAEVFTMVNAFGDALPKPLVGKILHTSLIQKLPFAKKYYRHYLPLMPFAVEQFDLSKFDLVISSSHAVAKGVITGPDTLHISYCYSPMRYAWDLQHEYLQQSNPNKLSEWLMRYSLHRIRKWDSQSSLRPDHIIAISKYIGRRIDKCYRRSSDVVYPPVATDTVNQHFVPFLEKDGYYIAASRLVPYKRIPLIAEALAVMGNRKLIIIGDGPEKARLETQINQLDEEKKANICYLGYQGDVILYQYLANAQALIFAAEEDFGILPIEAQSVGTPVIAFGRGALTETILDNKTGLFFNEASVESIIEAINRFEAREWDSDACVENAQRFSEQTFIDNLLEKMATRWNAFNNARS
ncbi:glycosyltransferase [Marinomonas algicola]|uniref:glycosyltransferase n=1 Tax=Marinomonas algicola TaxID=2773454 RepID=UPI001EFF088B|nr:glycosyltransferase [Marinomonas algicola]